MFPLEPHMTLRKDNSEGRWAAASQLINTVAVYRQVSHPVIGVVLVYLKTFL